MNQQEISISEKNQYWETINKLNSLVISQQNQLESSKAVENIYKVENQILRERIKKLTLQLYGRKSEKYVLEDEDSFDQKSLFEDHEDEGFVEKDCVVDDGVDLVSVPGHKRKKGGRKALPSELDRIEVVHDLSPEEKQCACGCEMSCIGEESSEKLEMLAPQIWVLREVRYKYACKECEGVESPDGEGAVKIAPLPAQLLPKSIATPSLLAHVFVSKFADALPFYRQEKQFLRYGLELTRSKMCHWAFKVSDKLKKLLEILWCELR